MGEKKWSQRAVKIAASATPLLVGVLIFIGLVTTKPDNKSNDDGELIRKVRFMKATPVKVQRIATGYGRVIPAREWKTFSEIKGRVLCTGFSLLQKKEVKKPQELVKKIMTGQTALDAYLRKRFSQEFTKKYHSDQLKKENMRKILVELNKVIQYDDLSEFFTPEKKEQEMITDSSRRLFFNRRALETAYQEYITATKYHFVKEGEFLAADAVICQVDPTEYYLFIEQREIAIEQYQAQIKELQTQLRQLDKILINESKRSKLLESEYNRKKRNTSSSDLDIERAHGNYLQALNSYQQNLNSKELIPVKIENLEAAKRLAQSQLRQAKLDLQKTIIIAPFAMRVSRKLIELNQFVAAGQQLFEGYGINEVEVVAQFQFRDISKGVFPANIKFRFHDFFQQGEPYFLKYNIPARVSMSVPDPKIKLHWKGKVNRLTSAVNEASQTVQIVVGVQDPYGDVIPGVRPPLVKGMYCKVELFGQMLNNIYCIPRSAYRQGKLLLLVNGNLQERRIEPEFYQEDYVIFTKGIKPGEQIILSEIFPAIAGTPFQGVDSTVEVMQNYPKFVEKESTR